MRSRPQKLRQVLICALCISIFMPGCGGVADYKPEDDIYTGKDAKEHLWHCQKDKLPDQLSDLWVFDGGSFGGSIYYVTFRCESIEDCWQAIAAFGAPGEALFVSGIQTQYAVNQHGPSFYWQHLLHPEWQLNNITNAVSYETMLDRDRMEFWAVDLDKMRVFYHRESGGFPDDLPTQRHR